MYLNNMYGFYGNIFNYKDICFVDMLNIFLIYILYVVYNFLESWGLLKYRIYINDLNIVWC